MSISLRILLAILPFAISAPAQEKTQTIQGVVYDDANRNQTRDPAEAGLAGIVVSDQFSVTTTGSTGAWRLDPAPNARVVFVSVPDGWTASGAFWRPIPAGVGGATLEFRSRAARSHRSSRSSMLRTRISA